MRQFVGLGVVGDVHDVYQLVCMNLAKLDFEWQFAKDKKIKCRIKLDREPLKDDEEFIQEFLLKKFLRVNISVLKEPNVVR